MWFLILYFISISIGVVIGLVKLKQLTTPYRLLAGLLVYTLISELVSELILKHIENPVYKNFNFVLYTIVFIFLISTFQYLSTHSNLFKKIIVIQGLGLLFSVVWISYQDGFKDFPSTQLILLSFPLIILSLYRLGELAQNGTDIPITGIPDFYASCAYLIFFFISITFWVKKKFFPGEDSEQIKLLIDWIFNLVCYINYLLLAYALFLNAKRHKNKSIG
jgi:hypothetical protein